MPHALPSPIFVIANVEQQIYVIAHCYVVNSVSESFFA